ncbi:MAG: hypothetical protein J6V44_04555 [Methanobrevibacter sp.]|nr:hypothetical protein [Methanobrevibacter sp.]
MTQKQVFELLKGVLLKRFPEKLLYINEGAKSVFLDGSRIFGYEMCPYVLIVKENQNILYAENLFYDKINNKISPSKEGKRIMDLRDYSVAKSNTEKEYNRICDIVSSEILRMKEYLKLNKMKEDFE